MGFELTLWRKQKILSTISLLHIIYNKSVFIYFDLILGRTFIQTLHESMQGVIRMFKQSLSRVLIIFPKEVLENDNNKYSEWIDCWLHGEVLKFNGLNLGLKDKVTFNM
jgi:hypothetical protein